jgi:hypothetical protein
VVVEATKLQATGGSSCKPGLVSDRAVNSKKLQVKKSIHEIHETTRKRLCLPARRIHDQALICSCFFV